MDSDFIVAKAPTKPMKGLLKQREDKVFSQSILLIEDDNVCLFVEHEILSRLTSGKIDTVKTVLEAKEKLRHCRYDLVVSDLCLEDGSAMEIISEAYSQAGSKNKNTPFIAVTAYRDQGKRQEVLAAGFKDLISKPLREDQARRFLLGLMKQNNDEIINIITRPVIDLKLGMERIGVYAKEEAIQVLELLITSLSADLRTLRTAEDKQNHSSMEEITHKIIGALHYSATPALEKAVQDLQATLKVGESSAISARIKNIEEQVKLLKAAYYDLLMYETY